MKLFTLTLRNIIGLKAKTTKPATSADIVQLRMDHDQLAGAVDDLKTTMMDWPFLPTVVEPDEPDAASRAFIDRHTQTVNHARAIIQANRSTTRSAVVALHLARALIRSLR